MLEKIHLWWEKSEVKGENPTSILEETGMCARKSFLLSEVQK
jgi:hypothetical protein